MNKISSLAWPMAGPDFSKIKARRQAANLRHACPGSCR